MKMIIRLPKVSHLLQMRGLKPKGIWDMKIKFESHLLQMRGLKPLNFFIDVSRKRSHLLQMRGLKPLKPPVLIYSQVVASFTDAWIETFGNFNSQQR